MDEALPTSVSDLAGMKVAIISGGLQDVRYDKVLGNSLLRLNTAPEVLAACETGVADYCLMDSVHFIGTHAQEKGASYCFSDTLGGNVGVAFNKASSDLCESYNAWLRQAKQDGIHADMIDRWTKADVEITEMPDLGKEPSGTPLRIGITTDFPFAYVKNNHWAGLEIEMARRWGLSIGRPVEFTLFDLGAVIAALETNKVDAVCAFMYITAERSKRVLFSDPYYSSHTVCFRHMGQTQKAVPLFSWSGIKESFHNNIIVEDRWKLIVDGLYETVYISFFAVLLGTLVGALICWMRMSRSRLLSQTARTFIDLVRGIPVLVILMVLFYIVFASSFLQARWVAIIAFAINFGSYVSEMFRTGISGVDRGQTEAALALGFTKPQAFFRYIVPQALKKILPVYKGEVISIIKSTSVVGYIAIQDLTKVSDIIRSRTFDAFFPLIIISVVYFLLTWLIGKIIDSVEVKI